MKNKIAKITLKAACLVLAIFSFTTAQWSEPVLVVELNDELSEVNAQLCLNGNALSFQQKALLQEAIGLIHYGDHDNTIQRPLTTWDYREQHH